MRRMVADDQDVYRVVIVEKKRVENPKYVPGLNAPYWIWLEGETITRTFGPYNKLGTAKGILTRETRAFLTDAWRPEVVSAEIEKAETKWIKVDE